MDTDREDTSELEERLDEVVADYLRVVEAGGTPDKQELLTRHPELATELAVFFADRDHAESWARSLRATVPASLWPRRVRCPHCHNDIEITPTVSEEVTCPSCGSSFRVAQGGPSPLAGRRTLGRFELLGRVGVGAFGTVYQARDPELDRVVALKVPRAGPLAGNEDLGRFLPHS